MLFPLETETKTGKWRTFESVIQDVASVAALHANIVQCLLCLLRGGMLLLMLAIANLLMLLLQITIAGLNLE